MNTADCLLVDDPEIAHASFPAQQLRRRLEDAQGYLGPLQASLAAALEVLLSEEIACEEMLQADQAPECLELATSEQIDELVRIFLIHGRELGQMESVARYLEKLGAEVLVLQELPNEGLTVIEKLLRYGRVQYAIALLTGDDQGGLRRRQSRKSMLNARPRQNVLFELGYFLGRIGRRRVCILRDPDIEIPSDIQGILTVTLDAEDAWRRRLVKELKAAGLPLDFSKAL